MQHIARDTPVACGLIWWWKEARLGAVHISRSHILRAQVLFKCRRRRALLRALIIEATRSFFPGAVFVLRGCLMTTIDNKPTVSCQETIYGSP